MDNRWSAGITVALGVGAVLVSLFPPAFIAALPNQSRAILGTIGALLLVGGIVGFFVPRLANFPVGRGGSAIRSKPKTIASPAVAKLNIIVQQGGVYDRTELSVIGTIHRTAQIGIKNQGNTLLSNCKVFCEIRDQNSKATRWLLTDIGGLSAGEERRLGIAGYTEPNAEGHEGQKSIQLHAPAGHGYGGFHPTLPDTGGSLWITAISDETPNIEAIVRLWVDRTSGFAQLRWQLV